MPDDVCACGAKYEEWAKVDCTSKELHAVALKEAYMDAMEAVVDFQRTVQDTTVEILATPVLTFSEVQWREIERGLEEMRRITARQGALFAELNAQRRKDMGCHERP